jgi:FkbM family methyltransferase
VADSGSDNYYQGTEYRLASELLLRLDDRIVLDVGAEKGGFADACLSAGAERVLAFEPYPPHVEHLRRRFKGSPAVTVFDLAIADHDGTATLHIAHDTAGEPMDYHHSLLGALEAGDVQWHRTIEVACRSLGSLVRDRTIPSKVGVLKIDTEGGDLIALAGMGSLESDVVMIEHCRNPGYAGDSPYNVSDVSQALGARGYRDYAFVKRNDGFEVIQIGTEQTRIGDWGNLLFVHRSVRDRLMPIIHHAAAAANDLLMAQAQTLRRGYTSHARTSASHADDDGSQKPAWIARATPGERERLVSGKPRISIVTPSFNQGRFLEQTMRSVLDQDYPNLEYIVIDGGSTDDSVDIIRRYADRLAYWISEPDRGQTDALNKGFSRATGDIVAWINSDDFYYPGAFAAAAERFRADPELGLLYGRGNRVAESGEAICEFEATRPFNLEALVYGVDYILQPTTFMRRQALHEVGPFDPHLHYAFDWELWMRLGERFQAGMLDRIIAAGREYPAAKTFTGGFPRAEEIRQIVRSHTGKDLSVGYLAYYVHTLTEALPAAGIGSRTLSAAVAHVGSVCRDLINEDRLHEGSAGRRSLLEVPAFSDGWVGSHLRLKRVIPADASYMCLAGSHEEVVARAIGPLILTAALDEQPLGMAVVQRAGPFRVFWRIPAEWRKSGNDNTATERMAVIAANGTSGWNLGHPDEPRVLAFRFGDLSFAALPPPGEYVASAKSNGAAEEAARAYRHAYSSTEPYGDGWVGPELSVDLVLPAAAGFLCLSGIHDAAVENVGGRLTLRASIDGHHLGTGFVRAPGPFLLCWRVTAEQLDMLRRSRDSLCTVLIASPTSVVPARFWHSTDERSIAFRFVGLEFRETRPRGGRVVRGPNRSLPERIRRGLLRRARQLRAKL